jgi:ribA/ribD-fused uncharacterized protein
MKYHLNWLKALFDSGERIKYIFFWGHQPNRDDSTGQSYMSQWWEQEFVVEGIRYPSAEHWMMAGKARLFDDAETLELILKSTSPAEAKKLGRQVKNFDQTTWEAHRYNLVREGNFHKFSQNEDLKNYLLTTGDRVLVEASPRDRIWGIGLGKNNPDVENPHNWRGLNLLGFALMEVRDELLKHNTG